MPDTGPTPGASDSDGQREYERIRKAEYRRKRREQEATRRRGQVVRQVIFDAEAIPRLIASGVLDAEAMENPETEALELGDVINERAGL